MGERDLAEPRREGVEVLRGDSGIVATIAGSLHSERKRRSLAVGWESEGRPTDLQGGDPPASAAIMRRLLEGEGGPIRDAVLLNTAGVLLAAGAANSIPDGIQAAAHAIDSGAARQKLEDLVELSNAGT